MADIDSALRQWSTTASNNKPTGATTLGTNLDDNLRTLQSVVRQYLASIGSTIASAATVDLSTADGRTIPVSGTATVIGLGTEVAGIEYILTSTGTQVWKNSSALGLPNAVDTTVVAGDHFLAQSKGSGNWVIPWLTHMQTYVPAATVSDITLGTEQSAAGTVVDFTGIPAWVKRITAMFKGVSTAGTSQLLLQIGNGSVVGSGYNSLAMQLSDASELNTGIVSTAGFILGHSEAGNSSSIGSVTLMLETGNTWVSNGQLSCNTGGLISTDLSNGFVALSGTLDRVRVTTVAGANALDAGSINISYE